MSMFGPSDFMALLVEMRELLRLIAARAGGYDGPWTREESVRIAATTGPSSAGDSLQLIREGTAHPRPFMLNIAGVAGGRAELYAGPLCIARVDYSAAGTVTVRNVLPAGSTLVLKNKSATALSGRFYI